MRYLLHVISSVVIGISQIPAIEAQTQQIEIQTLDERQLFYYVDKSDDAGNLPIILVVDGSGCIGQQRRGFNDLFFPPTHPDVRYARVTVEKPGVAPTTHRGEVPCSDTFKKYYTMENRVEDHLRVLQHLRKTAEWWNGELYVYGWSDGGDIATRLVAYYPNIDRAVIGAAASGLSMAEFFEDFWACPADSTPEDERDTCLADLNAQFKKMEDNPTWTETWSGEDAWRVWPGRLRARHNIVLVDNETPILIIHGALDFDSTPVEGARALIEKLESAENTAFTYWEIPNMAHGPGSFKTQELANSFELAVLDWLLNGEAMTAPTPFLE